MAGTGFFFVVVFLWKFISSWHFVATAQRTTAMVSELREQRGRNGMRYAPTFLFYDGNGQRFTTYSKSYRADPRRRVGALVPILYLPNNPTKARLDTYEELWSDSTVAALFAVSCFVSRRFLPFIFRVHGLRGACRHGSSQPS